ncbi:MAG: CpaF family protein, partial [Alphaproteobacteria bacterium]|nr:CpaF family protein [Alphaproteobacteria bacterium]
MFGKRTTPPSSEPAKKPEVSMPSIAPEASTPAAAPSEASTRQAVPKIDINEPAAAADGEGGAKINQRIEAVRERIWRDVRESLDLKNLASMEVSKAREEVQAAVAEIVRYRAMDLTKAEIIQVSQECADDMLGFGPLEPLLARDDIADIMINGPDTTYIEVKGKIEKAEIRFRDAHHLLTICQRIVGAIGRRVDESSPICDARLLDGSRVNVIIPPLSVDGASMTIRKFKKDKLTLDKLVEFGAMTPACAKLIMAIGRSRLNVLVSGGTGSGKTTMLNCLTRYIDKGERVITCEDA